MPIVPSILNPAAGGCARLELFSDIRSELQYRFESPHSLFFLQRVAVQVNAKQTALPSVFYLITHAPIFSGQLVFAASLERRQGGRRVQMRCVLERRVRSTARMHAAPCAQGGRVSGGRCDCRQCRWQYYQFWCQRQCQICRGTRARRSNRGQLVFVIGSRFSAGAATNTLRYAARIAGASATSSGLGAVAVGRVIGRTSEFSTAKQCGS